MDDSLSAWLALRETADWSARSESLVRRVTAALPSSSVVRAVDLCTGTGSNLRYLMDRLPSPQHWLVVDRDAVLLDEIAVRLSDWARSRGRTMSTDDSGHHIRGEAFACDVVTRQMNLNQLDAEIFDGCHLVTASALLDLVSEAWLGTLAMRCREVGAAALFAITYDGRSTCEPAEPEDEMIRSLLNRHQKTDKGLGGVSDGPDAWRIAERVFAEAGFQVEHAASDWSIAPSDEAFQRMLIDGWARAARELAPQQSATIADWHERRRGHVSVGHSRIVVGHADLAAWIPR